MRLCPSDRAIQEAHRIVREILAAYSGSNRTRCEIRDHLAHNTVDLFSSFAQACSAELLELEAPRTHRMRWATARLSQHEDCMAH